MGEEMSCIFCGEKPKGHNGPHHIISKSVKKSLGLTGARAQAIPTNLKLPMCGRCHEIVTLLQKPLIMIITHLTGRGPLPGDLGQTVEFVYEQLHSSVTKVVADGED